MLRTVGPFATLVCTVFLTAGPKGKQYMSSRWLIWLTLFMALFGSLISGGRAAIILAVAAGGAVLILRRRWLLLVVIGAAVIVGIALANLFADTINQKAPFEVARSIQLILIHKNAVASSSIESSSDWRKELFLRAWKEWESDPRIFWFGRATYAFTTDDLIAAARNGYEGMMVTSLRRGATHNLITDLLVPIGLVGLILYFALIITIIRFIYGLYRNRRLSPRLHDLTLICLLSVASSTAFSLIAESFLSIIPIWFLIALVVRTYGSQPAEDILLSTKTEISDASKQSLVVVGS
jgi:O-antigen ligase